MGHTRLESQQKPSHFFEREESVFTDTHLGYLTRQFSLHEEPTQYAKM